MNALPELVPLLQQLRLSGILDSCEARNREAIDRHLAYTDFLGLPVRDGVARRDQKKLARRRRRANFRSQKTLECFDFDRLPGLNRALVPDLATGRFVAEKVAVLIVGPCGTGKSHLAQAIGHLVARQGRDVPFSTQTRLLNGLRQAQAVGNHERRCQTPVNVPLLIIDDFGLRPLRPPGDETFHDPVAERYGRTATILTSNLDFGEGGDPFPANKMLGAATLDRLRHGAYRVVLDGASYRSPKPLLQPAPHPVAKGAKTTHA